MTFGVSWEHTCNEDTCRAKFMSAYPADTIYCPKCRRGRHLENNRAVQKRKRAALRKARGIETPAPPKPEATETLPWWMTEQRSADFIRGDVDDPQYPDIRDGGRWRGQHVPRHAFAGISATPLSRVEAQDVEGRRTYRK